MVTFIQHCQSSHNDDVNPAIITPVSQRCDMPTSVNMVRSSAMLFWALAGWKRNQRVLFGREESFWDTDGNTAERQRERERGQWKVQKEQQTHT